MLCALPPNCTGFPQQCAMPNPSPNSNSAEIYVMITFGIAWPTAVLFAMPIMLVGFLDMLVSPNSHSSRLLQSLRIEDSRKRGYLKQKLVQFVGHVTVGLSNMHIITGLVILIFGYAKYCTMINRHFWIVFDLSFFNGVTYLASFSALREYFRLYLRSRDFRVFVMLLNYILLLIVAILTFRHYDPKTRDCPVRCTFESIHAKQFGVSGMHMAQMFLLALIMFWQIVLLYMDSEIWDIRRRMIADNHSNGDIDLKTWEYLLRRKTKRLEELCSNKCTPMGSVINILKFRNPRKYVYQKLDGLHRRYKVYKTYGFMLRTVIMVIAPPAPVVWLCILALWVLAAGRLVYDRQWAATEGSQWGLGQMLAILIPIMSCFTDDNVVQEAKPPDTSEKSLHGYDDPMSSDSSHAA